MMIDCNKKALDHFTGCLLGGAIGDAMGAPVEFMSLNEVRRRYGAHGITDYEIAYGRKGAITDDTQMSLFTAEGLLQAHLAGNDSDIIPYVHAALLRWLHTQGFNEKYFSADTGQKVGLIGVSALHSRRAPGNTCLSALASGQIGRINQRINNSKGCGGVMRVAPVGLFFEDYEVAFEKGCQAAAITHGHQMGYLAAGCLASIISRIIAGAPLVEAVHETMLVLAEKPGHKECLRAIENAWRLQSDGVPSAENIERLGEGWIAEEALAIAIYCCLATRGDFEKGVLLAVNHGGDSDSTGAITGNILGALCGREGIPAKWIEELELREVIEKIASDLKAKGCKVDGWKAKYSPL